MKKNKKSGRPISSLPPWGELYRKVGQEKIAQDLGVAKSTISKWARNVHRMPKLAKTELLRMCKEHDIEEGVDLLKAA